MGSLSLLKFSILPSLWVCFVLQAVWKCEAESTYARWYQNAHHSVSWLVPKLSEKEKGKKGHHQNISVLKDQLTVESTVLGSDQCRPLWSMGWLNSNVECISVKMREAFPHTSWGRKESDTIQQLSPHAPMVLLLLWFSSTRTGIPASPWFTVTSHFSVLLSPPKMGIKTTIVLYFSPFKKFISH